MRVCVWYECVPMSVCFAKKESCVCVKERERERNKEKRKKMNRKRYGRI